MYGRLAPGAHKQSTAISPYIDPSNPTRLHHSCPRHSVSVGSDRGRLGAFGHIWGTRLDNWIPGRGEHGLSVRRRFCGSLELPRWVVTRSCAESRLKMVKTTLETSRRAGGWPPPLYVTPGAPRWMLIASMR